MGNDLMDLRIEKLVKASENTLSLMNVFRQEVASLGDRVDSVESTLDHFAMIHSGHAKKLRQAANARVRQLLKDEDSYRAQRSQYYSWLWTAYQNAFGVTSYTDTRLKHFEAAMDWIKEWQPIRSVPMDVMKESALASVQ